MFHFRQKDPDKIHFFCQPEDLEVIAPPVPAQSVLPEWYRKLPVVDANHQSTTDSDLTIKRCMPFLDAMMTGWILPLAATVRLEIKEDGRSVEAGWEFDRVMVSNHGVHQVAGNPKEPSPPCKFHNYWSIRTPPGWSCLFVPPLNRPSQPFECVAGIVDTDTYTAHIHFPFFATAPEVINLSLAGPANLLLEEAVRRVSERGIIIVAAVGNAGPRSEPSYPAAYEEVVAVTAIDRNKNPYRRAGRGQHIDLAAPGVAVWTAASVSGGRTKTGTSFAAPFVTAAAARMKGASPDLAPERIREALTRSAEDLGEPGKDPIFGWGLLNARALGGA